MIGSQFYIPRFNLSDARCVQYRLHPTLNVKDFEFCNSWDPYDKFTQRELESQIPLPQGWDAHVSNFHALLHYDYEELPDFVGEFSLSLSTKPVLVSSRVRRVIEDLAPGACEYVQAPKVHNLRLNIPMDASDHVGVNVLRQIDSWDRTQDTMRHQTRSDGTQYYSLYKEIGSAKAIPDDAHLWRDSFTNHVLCSELFKTRLEEMGATAIDFKAIEMA